MSSSDRHAPLTPRARPLAAPSPSAAARPSSGLALRARRVEHDVAIVAALVAALNLLRWLADSHSDAMLEDIGALMKKAVTRMADLQAPQFVVLVLLVIRLRYGWHRPSGTARESAALPAPRGARWTR